MRRESVSFGLACKQGWSAVWADGSCGGKPGLPLCGRLPHSPNFVCAWPACTHVEMCLRVHVLLLPDLFPLWTHHLL